MRPIPKTATPAQAQALREKWADYYRMRRSPTKICRGCSNEFPNDDKHFCRSFKGWLTSHCHACGLSPKTAGPTKPELCPLCKETAHLVRDVQTPLGLRDAPRVCRRCTMVINICRGKPNMLDRLVQYIRWSDK